MIGTTLGHYRIIELLGQGGMGEVYLAEDTKLQRRVALKLLARDLAGDPDRRQRFEREARAAAALNHPNIVTIHSVEEVDGVPFLTLEVLEGQTLATLIPHGGLPLTRLLALAVPLADAVGAAHQRGITHRDLKPANVMVSPDGRVKVLDFGLAKLKEDALASVQAGLPTIELTGEGRIVGTVAYMSPEQAEGKPVDPRSDVFSLGVMLHEMATGERPFTGDTQLSVLSAIIKDTPKSVTDLNRSLPRDLARIIKRCLAKDLEDRYQSAKDLRNDLRALKEDLVSGEATPVAAVRQPSPRGGVSRRSLMTGAVVAVMVLAALAAWIWRRAPGLEPAAGRGPFDTIKLTRLTTTGNAGFAAISPEGRYVAHVAAKDGQQSLWLRQVATSSNVQVVAPAEVRYNGVSFSPDGSYLYYVVYPQGENIGSLFQVPVLGGGARLIVQDIDSAPTFSPDGGRMAFLRGFPDKGASAVMVANVDGTNLRAFATRTRPVEFPVGNTNLGWSPDGRSIAVPGFDTERLRGQIVILDSQSGTEQVLTTHEWREIGHMAWLPGGRALLVNAQESAGESSNQIWLVTYPSGDARRITNDLSTYTGLSLSSDGMALVCIRNELRAATWLLPIGEPGDGQPVADAGIDDGVRGISWTPDGRIVYTSEASGNPDVWIMGADGSNRVQLTSAPGLDVAPRVTADGRFVVFVSDRDGGSRAWRMGLDGSNPTRLSANVLQRARVAVSVDGKWVYFSGASDASWKVPIDGGPALPVFADRADAAPAAALPPGFHEPMPSPDGRMIAGHYNDPEQRGERIVLITLDGSGTQKRFPSVPANAGWAPDGRSFIYSNTRAGVSNLWRQPTAGGAATQLTHFPTEQIFNFAISADQRQLAVVRGRVTSDVVLVASGEK